MEKGKPYRKKSVTNGDGGNYGKFERIGQVHINEGTRYPKSVIKVANDNHNSLHPTQKPVALLQYLIRTYTNPGELVLDNCMGSGTTAIAALREHRHFIGFEKDAKYFDIAVKRIDAERHQPSLAI